MAKLKSLVLIAGSVALLVGWSLIAQPGVGALSKPGAVTHVDPRRLEVHVRKLSQDLAPRDVTHPENLIRSGAWIAKELERAGGRLSTQLYTVHKTPYRNIIASFGPTDGERIIVGAHYDACGPNSGADDNASGVAGLLELAVLLRQSPLHRRVDLVAWTLEEPPFYSTYHMGSAMHARMLKASDVPVRAVLSLEMIGTFSDAPHSQSYPNPLLHVIYPSRANFIVVVGRFADRALVAQIKTGMKKGATLPVYSINAPVSIEGIDYSDHRSYWTQGYPAAMITDTAFFRNPNYHKASDTADTLDYVRMAQVVEGVYQAVVALAQ